MNYELPIDIKIDGEAYSIRKGGDYRVILDVIAALTDPDLDDSEKAIAGLTIFYEQIPKDPRKALEEMMRFVNCGEEVKSKPQPKLMDWEQDFPLVVAPINRILGTEIRSLPYLHWWSFISAYMEIGECTFSTVVGIRQKQKKGKKLEKWEQEYLRDHADLVKLKAKVSADEQAFLDDLLG
ncbi:MAG: hypothetical protein IJU41_03630 [Clostridia bacterium]|nr:hypothetical protein [Clostridia bacterium]